MPPPPAYAPASGEWRMNRHLSLEQRNVSNLMPVKLATAAASSFSIEFQTCIVLLRTGNRLDGFQVLYGVTNHSIDAESFRKSFRWHDILLIIGVYSAQTSNGINFPFSDNEARPRKVQT